MHHAQTAAQRLLGKGARVARTQRHDDLHVADIPALFEHHHADHDVVGVVLQNGLPVAVEHRTPVAVHLGDAVVVHGVDRAADGIPGFLVTLFLFADVDLDHGRAQRPAVRIHEQRRFLGLALVSGNGAALQVVPGRLAVAQKVRHFPRLVAVVRQNEQDRFARVAFVFELLLDLLPALDAGHQQVAILLPGVGLAVADVRLDLAGLLVLHLDPLQHRPLDDAVADGVGQRVVHAGVAERDRPA